jgi:hypothetical protein
VSSAAAVAVLLVFAAILVIVLLPIVGFGMGFEIAGAMFCGFFLIVLAVVIFVAVSGSASRRVIPPPPPIQQPMVPAGQQGPMELACPNCGAAPRTVDRFGVATCDYCNTRFLVR